MKTRQCILSGLISVGIMITGQHVVACEAAPEDLRELFETTGAVFTGVVRATEMVELGSLPEASEIGFREAAMVSVYFTVDEVLRGLPPKFAYTHNDYASDCAIPVLTGAAYLFVLQPTASGPLADKIPGFLAPGTRRLPQQMEERQKALAEVRAVLREVEQTDP
ncbi:hypothetical protein [Roseibium aggregatum]|uniref:hypothetical protein n=1 Tax=Roseibium aggregatum TaxID=187304 RepID=UPI003A981C40